MAVTDLQAGLMTADDLLRLYGEGVRGELIRGVLCQTTPTGNEHGVIVGNVASELRNFIKPRKLGRVTASDSGVWLEHDPDTVREPGHCLLLGSEDSRWTRGSRDTRRSSPTWSWKSHPPATPVAKSTTRPSCGSATAYAWYGSCTPTPAPSMPIAPQSRRINAHPGTTRLTGHDVLPGFTCNVSDIFAA